MIHRKAVRVGHRIMKVSCICLQLEEQHQRNKEASAVYPPLPKQGIRVTYSLHQILFLKIAMGLFNKLTKQAAPISSGGSQHGVQVNVILYPAVMLRQYPKAKAIMQQLTTITPVPCSTADFEGNTAGSTTPAPFPPLHTLCLA